MMVLGSDGCVFCWLCVGDFASVLRRGHEGVIYTPVWLVDEWATSSSRTGVFCVGCTEVGGPDP